MEDLEQGLVLPELPTLLIPEASNEIVSRLPPMPGGDDLGFSDYRKEQVKKDMAAIKIATETHKAYQKRNRAIARAKGRAAQRWAEGR